MPGPAHRPAGTDAGGIGVPRSALFLPLAIVQLRRERGWLLDEITRPARARIPAPRRGL